MFLFNLLVRRLSGIDGYRLHNVCEELDDPAVSALRRAIAEVKQHWSVIGWVTKNLLSRTPPCLGKLVKPLVPAAFTVDSTRQPALGVAGYGPFSLRVYHKEGPCPTNGDINMLMMMNLFMVSLTLEWIA
jgi:hypothetical protein